MEINVADHVKSIMKKLNLFYGKSLVDLITMFRSRKYEIRIAGETARDILLNTMPKNIELVSSASLYQMKKLFLKKEIKHSVDIADASITLRHVYHSYKISTICPVGVSSQPNCAGTMKAYWMINAYNRTFTIDSMFIDFDGTIYDYFHGYNDVINSRIRMNMDPNTLINGNYLRILKYFKLFGSLAKSEQGHDPQTLEAILANITALANVDGERLWSEFKTMLMHSRLFECVQPFIECDGGTYLGLPEKLNLFEFQEVASHQSNFTKHPLLGISYLCALLDTREDVMKLHQRLRLSVYERDLAIFIVKHKKETKTINDLIYYRKMCLPPSGVNKQIRREYVLELLKYHNKKALFEELLLMESPFHRIDPMMLQRQKNQLRPVSAEANAVETTDFHSNDNESDLTRDQLKQPLLIAEDWSVIRYTSSKKKQRLQ